MRKNKSQKGQYLQKVIDLRSSGVSFLGISKNNSRIRVYSSPLVC